MSNTLAIILTFGIYMAIDTKLSFCEAYNNCGGIFGEYEAFLQNCEHIARQASTDSVTGNAVSNARGAWYAWLLAIDSIRFNQANPLSHYLVKLPNHAQFDCNRLYIDELWNLIDDFRNKLAAVGNVNLVTSNPDYVIINREVAVTLPTFGNTITQTVLENIDGIYSQFVARCNLNDIVGYMGAKVSVRPDRRIQLLHEGSLTKAIYAHLQTRMWLIDAIGIKYYAVSINFTEADKRGLRSVATHSIASSALKPQPAVDDVVAVSNTLTANSFFTISLTP